MIVLGSTANALKIRAIWNLKVILFIEFFSMVSNVSLRKKEHFFIGRNCSKFNFEICCTFVCFAFFKIGVFKISVFTGKHLCWSFFLTKLQAWRSAILLKRLQHRRCPVNIAEFLRTAFLIEHLWWLPEF